MTTAPQFAMVVVYADDVAATVAFYERVTGLAPSYYDEELGFAVLGVDQAVAIASHAAGALMLEAGYERARGGQVRGWRSPSGLRMLQWHSTPPYAPARSR